MVPDQTVHDREQPAGGVIVAVSAVVVRDGRVLLVRRAKKPALGRWSLPGGHLLLGELLAEGVRRELQEETGLVATSVEPLAGVTEILRPGLHYLVLCYRAEVDPASEAVAASDAAEVAWVDGEALATLETTDGLREYLESHSVFAPPRGPAG